MDHMNEEHEANVQHLRQRHGKDVAAMDEERMRSGTASNVAASHEQEALQVG